MSNTACACRAAPRRAQGVIPASKQLHASHFVRMANMQAEIAALTAELSAARAHDALGAADGLAACAEAERDDDAEGTAGAQRDGGDAPSGVNEPQQPHVCESDAV